MGLQKNFNYKGKTANYWCIIEKNNKKVTGNTIVTLGLYWDKAARDEDIKNKLEENVKINIPSIEPTYPEIWEYIKRPLPLILVPEIKDENGNIVQELVVEEQNYFADAIDIFDEGQPEN